VTNAEEEALELACFWWDQWRKGTWGLEGTRVGPMRVYAR